MAPKQITPEYFVAPQIVAEDVPALKEAGFTLVICNRPDGEVPPALQADAIGQAVQAAGMAFEVLPLTHQTMTPDNVARQRELLENATGPVLAYCASGTRSTVVWAIGHAPDRGVDGVLSAAAEGGYDLEGLRPMLNTLV
ncbi:TIGR01244 family sulfur transferase [Pseudoprimorskyibacter insulae]|uniref:Beta-lactamase hydrolase-like protein n=1 Tax=Pseudoprimorskyibacter insulae TaxID=1695997 RepID=A0A2R8B015_9RHOB|nr:TIGR01244 family sulfur transferase [Pseudoprimorskyibacter insulae]SPF81557.1 Beta-lactamase hydrolase-like protein [Pseudoprimorskyibacter insulae]